jgi:hypothetical protein
MNMDTGYRLGRWLENADQSQLDGKTDEEIAACASEDLGVNLAPSSISTLNATVRRTWEAPASKATGGMATVWPRIAEMERKLEEAIDKAESTHRRLVSLEDRLSLKPMTPGEYVSFKMKANGAGGES